MRKVTAGVLVALFLVVGMPVFTAEKGASAKAYEHASEESIFNRIGDWFATVGKSPEEKEKILMERKAERAAKRAEKEAKKAQKEAEEAKEKLKGKMKDLGK